MDKKVYPTPKANNNRGYQQYRPTYSGKTYYDTILENRLKEEKNRREQLERKVNSLEDRVKKIEKSKIVTAPLKNDIILDDAMKRRQQITAKRNDITSQRVIQAYKQTMSQTPVQKPIISNLNIQKVEKPSLWQKFKKSLKNFFADGSEVQKNSVQHNNSNNLNNSSNYKYNQFRQSIQKTTINTNISKQNNNSNRKSIDHTFDRYA